MSITRPQGDSQLTIPEEAVTLAVQAVDYAATDETTEMISVALEAAAPLILAAELQAIADALSARAVERHQIGEDNGPECDEDCEMSGCHAVSATAVYLMTRDRLLRRAAELRGGDTR